MVINGDVYEEVKRVGDLIGGYGEVGVFVCENLIGIISNVI